VVAADPLERAKVAGVAAAPGRTELQHLVERLVAGDRVALGELTPITGLTMVDAWNAIGEIFGASPEAPRIDPARTRLGARRAAARVREVAAGGGRIAFATAAPASLLILHLALARLARVSGAEVASLADIGPLRADGRSSRCVRFIDGVAVVSDGSGLCATRDGEAAREWLFVLGRPRLVVADGPFAEVAWEGGAEVIAFAGLDRLALAVAAARGRRCTVVPMRTDRPPRAYDSVVAGWEGREDREVSPEM
jgi:hypothetical protein